MVRFLWANNSNNLFFDRVLFNSTSEIINKPEILVFFSNNFAEIDHLQLINISISSRGDPSLLKDDTITNAFSNTDNYEELQASIRIQINNQINFKNLKLSNLDIKRKYHMGLTIIYIGLENNSTFKYCTIQNASIDSQGDIGFALFIMVFQKNTIFISYMNVYLLNLNTFSIALFFAAIRENFISLSNSSFNSSIFMHKSNQQKILEFYNYVGNTEADILLKLKTEMLKFSNLFVFLISNHLLLDFTIFEDLQCLANCVLVILNDNILFLNSTKLKKIESKIMSSGIIFIMNNSFTISNSEIIQFISISGPFLSYYFNLVIILDCYFFKNIALSVIGKEDIANEVISGSVFLWKYNYLHVKNSKFLESKTDIFGGALTANLRNMIMIESCVFQDFEIFNKGSKGIVLMLFNENTLYVKDCKFLNSIGFFGAFLFALANNTILFEYCSFTDSIGIDGGAFFLNENITLGLLNCSLKNVSSKESGILKANKAGNKILFLNCTFVRNGINLNDFLIKMNFGSFMVLNNVIINYEDSIGSLIECTDDNFVVILNSSIFEVRDAHYLIKLDFGNNIWLKNCLIQDLKSVFIIFADSKNFINFESTQIRECKFESSLIYILQKNTLNLNNMRINSIESSNKINGGFCYLSLNNRLSIIKSLFEDLVGGGYSLLMIFEFNNEIEILSCKFIGNVILDSIPNNVDNSSIFLGKGDNNTIVIKRTLVKQFVKLFISEKICFLILGGRDNFVIITETNITLQNHSSFLKALGMNNISINLSIHRFSFTVDTYIILENTNSFYVEKSIFKKINLESNTFIFNFINVKAIAFKSNFFLDNHRIFFSNQSKLTIIKSCFRKSIIFNSSQKFLQMSFLSFFISSSITIIRSDIISIGDLRIINIKAVNSTIKLNKNTFLFNKGSKGGVLFAEACKKIELINNSFISNSGENGGVFFFEEIYDIKIVNNKFRWNTAFKDQDFTFSRGGCFYFKGKLSKSKTSSKIFNNQFLGNKAHAGGVFFLERESLALDLIVNNYQKNKGKHYGEIYASGIKNIYLVPGTELSENPSKQIFLRETLSISNDTSQSESCLVTVAAFDYFNQTIKDADIFKITGIVFMGNLISNFKIFRGCLCMNSPLFNTNQSEFDFPVSKLLTLKFTPSLFFNQPNLLNETETLEIGFFLRYCDIGEYLDPKYMLCKACLTNFYSFGRNISKASSCLSCLDKVFYCYGGNDLSPKRGYWRLNENTVSFFECPNHEGNLI